MPNQYTQGYVPQRLQVLEFVCLHPQCTTSDIIASLKIGDHARVGTILTRLYHEGLVVREKNRGQRHIRWSAVEDEEASVSLECKVQGWVGEDGRDVLTAALFGPARTEVPA